LTFFLTCRLHGWIIRLFGEPRRFKLRALNPLVEINDEKYQAATPSRA
jgi:hypothetical protein